MSPGRVASISLHEDTQTDTHVKDFINKDGKHGDIYTRSSMYSTKRCPHCNRMFAEAAALRHVPICSSIVAKPKTLEEKHIKLNTIEPKHIGMNNT